jgi:hypothetical protein
MRKKLTKNDILWRLALLSALALTAGSGPVRAQEAYGPPVRVAVSPQEARARDEPLPSDQAAMLNCAELVLPGLDQFKVGSVPVGIRHWGADQQKEFNACLAQKGAKLSVPMPQNWIVKGLASANPALWVANNHQAPSGPPTLGGLPNTPKLWIPPWQQHNNPPTGAAAPAPATELNAVPGQLWVTPH